MRTILISFAALACLVSCSDVSTTPFHTRGEIEHESVARSLIEAWNSGNVEDLQKYGADNVEYHYRGETRVTNFEELKDLIAHWRNAFPDFKMTLEKVIADGDFLAIWLYYEGTHEGVWFGTKPTGKRVRVDEVMFLRFEEGRVAEIWEIDDQLSMREQLGMIP